MVLFAQEYPIGQQHIQGLVAGPVCLVVNLDQGLDLLLLVVGQGQVVVLQLVPDVVALHVDQLDGVLPLGQLLAVLLPQHAHHLHLLGQLGPPVELKQHGQAQQAADDGVQALRDGSALGAILNTLHKPGNPHADQHHHRAEQARPHVELALLVVEVKDADLPGKQHIGGYAERHIGQERPQDVSPGVDDHICGGVYLQANQL